MSNYIDISTNIISKCYDFNEMDNILCKSRKDGVTKIINLSDSIQNSYNNFNEYVDFYDNERYYYKEKFYSKLYSTAGINPLKSQTMHDQSYDCLKLLLEKKLVIGVGLTGLDYTLNISHQQTCFKMHVELSNETKKPLIFYYKDSINDIIEILKKSNIKYIVNYFNSNEEDTKKLLDIDSYFCMSNLICDEKNKLVRQFIKKIPIEKILVGTIDTTRTNNQQMQMFNIFEKLSNIYNINKLEIEKIIYNNSNDVFNLI